MAIPQEQNYNPNRLLDHVMDRMRLKNDAALSRLLEVAPPVISKIRHHRNPLGASMMIRIHEETGMSIREIRIMMGDRRQTYRLSNNPPVIAPTPATNQE